MKEFPLRSGTRQVCTLLPWLCDTVLEVLAMAIREKKRYKRNPNWKGRSKTITSLFADDMILYIETPEDATRKVLEYMNEFGKVGG